MVDTIGSYRLRYVVGVPASVDDEEAKEWAMDSVTCEDAQEFSQLYIGENISSARVMTEFEVIKQFDEDNDYLKEWDREKKLSYALVLDADGNIISGQSDLKQSEVNNGNENYIDKSSV